MRLPIALVLALTLAAPGLAQDDAATIASLRKELADLQAKRAEARRAAEKTEAVAPLRKARDEAQQKYVEMEKNDAGLAAAAKALKEAQGAYEKLLADKAAASPEAARANKQREALEAQRHALMLQDEVAQIKLISNHSPIQQALERDPEIAALRKAYQAIDPKDKSREAARQKYDDARKARLQAMPEGKALLDERARIKESIAALDNQLRELEAAARTARQALQKADDPGLAAARAKVAAAQKEMSAARDSDRLKAARDDVRRAEQALHEKTSQILDADPATKGLKTTMEAKSAQLAELLKKNRKAEK